MDVRAVSRLLSPGVPGDGSRASQRRQGSLREAPLVGDMDDFGPGVVVGAMPKGVWIAVMCDRDCEGTANCSMP